MLTFMAIAALAALLVWKIGAPVARFGGALMVIASLAFVILGDPIAPLLPLLGAGVALWLAGHFLAAYKNRFWCSRLAENIVIHTPLRYIDPVNGHERRQMRREDRSENAEAGSDAETGSELAPAEERAQVEHFADWERELATDDVAPTPAAEPAPARPSRNAVYGKRAAKAAGRYAARKVPGGRTAQSAWRFLR